MTALLIVLGIALAVLWVTWWVLVVRWNRSLPTTTEVWPLREVRRLYEGVPVYSTRRAALAAFDLSPLAPSPTDEDFWTRSAQ